MSASGYPARTDYREAIGHKFLDTFEHFRTHGVLLGEHEYAVFHTAVEDEVSVLHAGMVLENIGIDIVE